jgi:predicted nucleic-acid-binding protein
VAAGERCWITTVAMCETVWVLRGAYALEKQAVVTTLERILMTAQFAIEAKDAVRRAVEDYREGKGDFADYVIGRCGQESGCSVSATFDRNLKASAAFRLL